MQIDFYGANCIRLKSNNTTVVFDDNLQALNGNPVATANDVVCITNSELITPPKVSKITFDIPGSYEVSDILIDGVAASSFTTDSKFLNSTIYKVSSEGMSLVVLGHIKPDLTEEQLEQLGAVNVLFIPVGNAGYTLDTVSALKVCQVLNPQLVIPTHYTSTKLNYQVEQQGYQEFIKALGVESLMIEGTLKLKKTDLGEQLQAKVFADS